MRGLLGTRARWAAPSRGGALVLGVVCAVVAASGAWMGWSLLGAPSQAATMAAAYDFAGGPLRLARAQEAAWRLAVRDGGGLVAHTDALLAPPLPPALCAAGIAGADELVGAGDPPNTGPETGTYDRDGAMAARDLDRLIRRADRAIATGDRTALPSAADALREAGARLDGDAGVVARYAIARTLAAGNDLGAAARLIEEIGLASADGGGLPMVSAPTAAATVRAGGAAPFDVLMAFHARYLAGFVAYRRDQPVEAIANFRRALNAVNYHLSAAGATRRGGNYERVVVAPGILACGASSGNDLTSLDAYAGLVAAYMAAPGFRDPGRLAAEVSRRRSEIDPRDPLAPLLVHAREVARLREESPIPEHIFWASSNLQRVYHYNRMRPDPRLAVTRAVLTLRVLDDAVWTQALGLGHDTRCDILGQVAAGLREDGAAMGDPGSPLARADSAWAAAAVHTFARVESQCPGLDAGVTDGATRGRLLGLAGGLLQSGLVARYEGWRRVLEDGEAVSRADAAARVLERAAGDARFFGGGRVPPDMSAGIDPATGAAFVAAWRRAVFRDVAEHLVEQVEAGDALSRIRARDAGRYLGTVNAAATHAGLRPAQVYRPETLALMTRSQGEIGALVHRVRYHARSYPWATGGFVALLTWCALALAVLAFVNWWRFALLTRTRFYGAEAARRVGPGPR